MDYNQAIKNILDLYKKREYQKSKKLSTDTLKLYPNSSSIWYILALSEYNLGNLKASLTAFNNSAKDYSKNAGWHIEYGNLLFSLLEIDRAYSFYKKAISLGENNKTIALAWNGVGNVYFNRQNFKEAINCYLRAVENNPNDMGFVNNIAETYKKIKSFDKAYEFYIKALEGDKESSQEIQAFRHFQVASLIHYYSKGDNSEVLKYLNPILNFPRHQHSGRVAGLALFSKLKVSEWSDFEILLEDIHRDIQEKKDTLNPFHVLQFPSFGEEEHRFVASKNYIKNTKSIKKTFPKRELLPLNKRLLKVAFVSSDIASEHPVYQVIKGVLRNFNKNRIELYIYSIDDNRSSKYRDYMERLVPYCYRLYDMSKASDFQIAEKIYKDKTDIVIDLNGLTKGARLNIFAYSPAPIIVNWLGYPSSVGSKFHNWIIGDKYVTPFSSQKAFSEHIWQMPTSYFPTDNEIPIPKPTSRESANLPADKFIFAGFSNSYKINPTTFDAWCDILKAVPNSILWLREYTDTNKENLYMEAQKRGIKRDRVIFAGFTPTVEEHYARIQLADLALDTSPYNMHATAIDFLSMGVPVLTLKGNSFASRVGESFSHAINMPDMIMADYKSYTQKAIEIASNPDLHQKLKKRTKKSRINSPLFDTKKMARDLEDAWFGIYKKMYQEQEKLKLKKRKEIFFDRLASEIFKNHKNFHFSILEVGAVPLSNEPEPFYQLLKAFPSSTISAIEVDKELCDKLNQEAEKGCRFYAEPLGLKDETRDFYEAEAPMCSSLYRPNENFYKRYNRLYELAKLKNRVTIDTISLDSFVKKHQIDDLDFIKIDIQGAELDVFRGGVKTLESVVSIVTEVEFVPLYINQPLFGDVCSFLTNNRFMFHKFLGLAGRTLKPYILNNPNFATQHMWSDALFFRDIELWEDESTEKLIKIGIFALLYKSYDVTLSVFKICDERDNSSLTQIALKYIGEVN